jgi:hypothetical protein
MTGTGRIHYSQRAVSGIMCETVKADIRSQISEVRIDECSCREK